MEPHNSRFVKIRGARFAPPMGAMPHPTLAVLILIGKSSKIVRFDDVYLNYYGHCVDLRKSVTNETPTTWTTLMWTQLH